MPTRKLRIALLVDTSSGWGRRVIRGVANYALKNGGWHLSVDETGINETMHLKSGWQGDGIIARVTNRSLFEELIASGKPIVNISGIRLKEVRLPCVTSDREQTARLGLEHFHERGFRHLAYVGPERQPYVRQQATIYRRLAEADGLDCTVFQSKLHRVRHSRESEREEIRAWVRDLPKPVGILTWGTRLARDIITLCDESEIPIPDDVAVLAGDDDELLCEVCSPSLSSIVSAANQIGHEAARMMADLLSGKPLPQTTVELPPVDLVTRASTDTVVFDNPAVARAVNFIRERADRCIHVGEVTEAVGVPRRSLERYFEIALGHSPAREIQRAHLLRAQKLLRDTDMAVADIASASGYGSPEYMISIFNKMTRMTPQAYRQRVRSL
jgi:LacI family transcriptional regulator